MAKRTEGKLRIFRERIETLEMSRRCLRGDLDRTEVYRTKAANLRAKAAELLRKAEGYEATYNDLTDNREDHLRQVKSLGADIDSLRRILSYKGEQRKLFLSMSPGQALALHRALKRGDDAECDRIIIDALVR